VLLHLLFCSAVMLLLLVLVLVLVPDVVVDTATLTWFTSCTCHVSTAQ
jgi:hypothetical protein